MKWRDRLTLLLGSTTAASLLALPEQALGAPSETSPNATAPPEHVSTGDALIFLTPEGTDLQLIAHASHSSHASHASHSSHSSGSGGGYAAPYYPPPAPPAAPVYSPPPPPARVAPYYSPGTASGPAPSSASSSGVTIVAGGQTDDPPLAPEISRFVQNVQLALIARGYDPGPADGHLGPRTSAAVSAFQTAGGLPATGYIDAQTTALLGLSTDRSAGGH